jgi:hypothetical protein
LSGISQENISRRILIRRETERPRPDKELPSCQDLLIGQRLAIDAAAGGRTERGEFLVPSPEALRVNAPGEFSERRHEAATCMI